MGPARIYPWRKMHRSRAPSIAPGTFFVAQSWADSITDMPGFNLRQAQLSYVIPKYVVLLKGSDHHTAALKAIIAGDADGAEREIVADITEAAHYLAGLADSPGQLRRT